MLLSADSIQQKRESQAVGEQGHLAMGLEGGGLDRQRAESADDGLRRRQLSLHHHFGDGDAELRHGNHRNPGAVHD